MSNHYSSNLISSNHYQSQSANNQQKESQSDIKQSFSRRLFFNLFCFNCISNSPNQIRSEKPATRQASVIQRLSKSNHLIQFHFFMKQCLNNDKKCFSALPLHYLESNALIQDMMLNPIVCLKRVDRQHNIESETCQDNLCDYVSKKYFQSDKIVFISCLLPSVKLNQACSSKTAFTIIDVSDQGVDSWEDMSSNLLQIQQQQRMMYDQAELNKTQQNLQDYIFTNNYHVSKLRVVDTIIICPYLNATKSTPHISQDTIQQFVIRKMENIIRNTPDKLENIVIILPGSTEIRVVNNILGYENTSFYQCNEGSKVVQKILSPASYRYVYHKKPTFNQKEFVQMPPVTSNKIPNITNRSCSTTTTTLLSLRHFIKYAQVTGLYSNDSMQYIVIRFKSYRDINVLKQSERTELLLDKLHMKQQNLQRFFMNNIFFADTLAKQSMFRNEMITPLLEILNSCSFASLSQCVHHFKTEGLVEVNDLQNGDCYLRYLSILIGSGLIQNEIDLSDLQQILFNLMRIKPIELQFQQPIKPRNNTRKNTILRLSKQNSNESDPLYEFSFEMPHLDRDHSSEFGGSGFLYDPDEDALGDFRISTQVNLQRNQLRQVRSGMNLDKKEFVTRDSEMQMPYRHSKNC